MTRSVGYYLSRSLALLWSAFTSLYLLVLSALILRDAGFSLKLGSINTTGHAGLWVTLLPGMLGLAGVLMVLARARAGAWLLGIYSLFRTGVLLAAMPAVWRARSSFCTRYFCITTPWLARLLPLALATPFLLIALWAFRESVRSGRNPTPAERSRIWAVVALAFMPAPLGRFPQRSLS